MQKTILAMSVAAALAAPTLAAAQASAAPTVPGNMTIASEYRFRGIDQTAGKPAIQGGLDYSHSSGAYVGNWNSNVSEGAGFPGASIEMDFYGGFKKSFGDFGADIGFIYYAYPGTQAGTGISFSPSNNRTGEVHNGSVNNKELYIGGTWKWLSLKWYRSMGDYFSAPGTKGTTYIDLSGTYDLGGGFGVNAHIGRLSFKNMDNASYTDWKLGATYDVMKSGWVLGAAYIGTNAKGDCAAAQFYCFSNPSGTSTRDAGRDTVVLTLGKTF